LSSGTWDLQFQPSRREFRHSGDDQVLVFHFPGVIHSVERGVPDEEAEGPGAGHLTLGVERPNGPVIGVTMRVQARLGQRRILGRAQPELLGPVLLRGERMTDDVVPIASSSDFKSNWSLRGCTSESPLGPSPSPTS
jgi:hypothetical protein